MSDLSDEDFDYTQPKPAKMIKFVPPKRKTTLDVTKNLASETTQKKLTTGLNPAQTKDSPIVTTLSRNVTKTLSLTRKTSAGATKEVKQRKKTAKIKPPKPPIKHFELDNIASEQGVSLVSGLTFKPLNDRVGSRDAEKKARDKERDKGRDKERDKERAKERAKGPVKEQAKTPDKERAKGADKEQAKGPDKERAKGPDKEQAEGPDKEQSKGPDKTNLDEKVYVSPLAESSLVLTGIIHQLPTPRPVNFTQVLSDLSTVL
jgi:hypothetical protein